MIENATNQRVKLSWTTYVKLKDLFEMDLSISLKAFLLPPIIPKRIFLLEPTLRSSEHKILEMSLKDDIPDILIRIQDVKKMVTLK